NRKARFLHEIDSGSDAQRSRRNDIDVFRNQRPLLRGRDAETHQRKNCRSNFRNQRFEETNHLIGEFERDCSSRRHMASTHFSLVRGHNLSPPLVIPCVPISTKDQINPMRRLRIIISASLLLLASTFVFRAPSAQQPTNKISIRGLHSEVTVRRDERGIPYIEAMNDDDLYFGQGYVTATDRMFQMDILRRNVRGELAEILGANALAEDKRHRTLGFAKVVDESAQHLPPNLNQAMSAYAQGVNAYIDSLNDQNLPPEFRILQYKPRH